MKRVFYCFLIVAVTGVFTACSKEELQENAPMEVQVGENGGHVLICPDCAAAGTACGKIDCVNGLTEADLRNEVPNGTLRVSTDRVRLGFNERVSVEVWCYENGRWTNGFNNKWTAEITEDYDDLYEIYKSESGGSVVIWSKRPGYSGSGVVTLKLTNWVNILVLS